MFCNRHKLVVPPLFGIAVFVLCCVLSCLVLSCLDLSSMVLLTLLENDKNIMKDLISQLPSSRGDALGAIQEDPFEDAVSEFTTKVRTVCLNSDGSHDPVIS